MGAPARFPSGVNATSSTRAMGYYPMIDTVDSVSEYSNDFTASSAEYSISGSSSTFALGSAEGGVAVVTPGGTTTDTTVYRSTNTVKLTAGKKAWFKCRFKVSAVAGNVAYRIGLQSGSSAADGIWFNKPAATTAIKLVGVVGSSSTNLATALATAVADTYITLAFFYDGLDIHVFVNDALTARVSAPTLTTALLAPVFQITPTATDTVTVDYVLASNEISR